MLIQQIYLQILQIFFGIEKLFRYNPYKYMVAGHQERHVLPGLT